MQQLQPAGESVKEQVVDTVPKRIKELKFGLPYVQDIEQHYCEFPPKLSIGQTKTS